MLQQGGFVMYILGIASVCLVWFTVEGFVILRANKLAPPALIARLREAFKAGNYQEGVEHLQNQPLLSQQRSRKRP